MIEGVAAIVVGILVWFAGPPLMWALNRAFIEAIGFGAVVRRLLWLQLALVYLLAVVLVAGGAGTALLGLWHGLSG